MIGVTSEGVREGLLQKNYSGFNQCSVRVRGVRIVNEERDGEMGLIQGEKILYINTSSPE